MPRPDTIVTLALALHQTTERAYLVDETGNCDKTVWLPRSQVEMDETPKGQIIKHAGGLTIQKRNSIELAGVPVHDFLVPEWLARERGLL